MTRIDIISKRALDFYSAKKVSIDLDEKSKNLDVDSFRSYFENLKDVIVKEFLDECESNEQKYLGTIYLNNFLNNDFLVCYRAIYSK